MSMKRNLSSETSEKHWDFVKRVADRVSQWPAWKQAQFRIVIGDPQAEECQQNEPPSNMNLSGHEANAIRIRQVA
jgi:hypothetical protein